MISEIKQIFRTLFEGSNSHLRDEKAEKNISSETIKTKEFWFQNKDVCKGYELFVTISPDTPLKYLKAHGTIVKHPNELFDVPQEYGIWILYFGDEEGYCASQFGQISTKFAKETAVPFLIKYREIEESNSLPNVKYQKAKELGEEFLIWKDLIAVRNDNRILNLGEFWAKQNLMKRKGIGPVKAWEFINRKIYCNNFS